MATVKWDGSASTDPTNAANWSTGSVPVANDDVVFDATSDGGNNCTFNGTFPSSGDLNSITISSDFTKLINTGGTSTINLEGVMTINKTACIDADHSLTFDFNAAASTTVYEGGGSSYSVKPFVVFSSGMTDSVFLDATSRSNTTFNFAAQNFTMIDGVYPNITGTGTLYAKSIYSDASRALHNTYGSVDMLAINGIAVASDAYNIYDYDKQFYFEGALTAIGNTFKFGHTTVRLKGVTGGANRLPVNGERLSNAWGNDTNKTFYTEYHKIVIENGNVAADYWNIGDGKTLECNELVINDGGRLYGPSNSARAATIRSVKRPTVQGDWNFRQLNDGVYESVNDSSNTSVYEGGTGRQTLTKDYMLYGEGMDQVGLRSLGTSDHLNLSIPLFYQRDSLGSNAYDLRTVAAAASSSAINGFPMAATGKVIAVSFHSGGTSIGADANNQTFEVRTNGGSGTNIQFSRNDMTNTNGTNYTYSATGLNIAFNANDQLQIRRTAGSLVFGHVSAIVYIRYD